MSDEMKVALVTGGNGGIGTAICQRLAKDGFKVVASYYPAEAEAAQAWHDIISGLRSAAGGMTLTTPEEPVAAAEPERVEPEEAPVQEMESKPEPDTAEEEETEIVSEASPESEEPEIDTQTLHEEIVSLLEDTPDGLRMVEIAENLRIENWRSLIPVMRELMDDGEVKKEDSTYFVA